MLCEELQMGGRKNKTKVCDKVSVEDRISQLPDPLISEILFHVSTEDAVRTSVLSTRWRNLWQSVPELDLDSYSFSNFDAFRSFVERFFDSHRESLIRKLRLSIHYSDDVKSYLTRWIDSVGTRRIQLLDVSCYSLNELPPLSISTYEKLVQLRLHEVALLSSEFVSLPCLKIMHLVNLYYPNESTLQKLISGSPVLEDLTIIKRQSHDANVLQVRSQTLKRIHINEYTKVVIDAPLLQCLKTKFYNTKNYQIIHSGFSGKLDIDVVSVGSRISNKSVICDILTDISRVKDLVIGSNLYMEIFLHLESGPMMLQFRHLSHLNARIYISDLQLLPVFLESCPKLESLMLELVKHPFFLRNKKDIEPKVMFSIVPQCLVSSLKLVELKRAVPGYEGDIELLRYFLKNSTILEKLKVDVYYTKKAECDFLKQLLTMPRCSSACEIHCSFISKNSW